MSRPEQVFHQPAFRIYKLNRQRPGNGRQKQVHQQALLDCRIKMRTPHHLNGRHASTSMIK